MKSILVKANSYRIKWNEYDTLARKYIRLADRYPNNTFYKQSYKRYSKLMMSYYHRYDDLIDSKYTKTQIMNAGARDGKYMTLGFLRKLDKLKGK